MFEDDNPIQKAECDLLKRSEYAKKNSSFHSQHKC